MQEELKKLAKLSIIISLCSFQLYAQVREIPKNTEQVQLSYSPVIEQAGPAVVNIYAVKFIKSSISPLLEDPNFRSLLGIHDDSITFKPETKMQRSLGSGVIVRADGLIVTNYHVIKNADKIKVILADKREYEATIVVHEKETDLAILQLKGAVKDLPFLKLRDADTIKVGDIVLAIGNPFGLGQTVTNGIVSAMARSQIGASDFRSFIQTDASINPGNSGGALVTMDGRLAGINTFILSKSGGSMGIGFAIPSNLIVPLIASAGHGGKIVRPWDGLIVQNITAQMAESLRMERPSGVIIKDIYPGSPAEKSGLKIGDIVIDINGKEVESVANYKYRVAVGNVDKENVYKILREDKSVVDVNVKLESPPEANDKKVQFISGRNPLSGSYVANMSPALAIRLGLDFKSQGILLVKIEPGSLASRIGLLPGDIILKINDEKVESLIALQTKLTRTRGGWKITFRRGSEEATIAVTG